MILVATSNFFVHKRLFAENLQLGEINSITGHKLFVGEGAVYSALIIKLMQGEPYVLGTAGGINGRFIKNFMDKSRIKSDILWKYTETRSEVNIIDEATGANTVLLEDNFTVDEQDIKHFKHKFHINLKDVTTVLINNIPLSDGSSNKLIEEIITVAKENNQKIIISLSKEELLASLLHKPYGIVINNNDLEILGIDSSNEKEWQLNMRNLVKSHSIKYLLYDNIEDENIYLVTKNKITCAKYGKFNKDIEDRGSKDLLSGILAIAASRKYEMEKITKLAAAVMGASKASDFPKICQRKEVDELYKRIKLITVFDSSKY